MIRDQRFRAGFTLIELLVVVLILAILMAVSIPLYLSAVKDSQTKTCRANMQTIANAVQASKVRNMNLDYASYMGSFSTANVPDLSAIPQCPLNGTYSLSVGSSGSNTTFKINCTMPGHNTFEPGVDSN